MTTYAEARRTWEKHTERYNREYRAGLWSTNRPLASKCENAYSAMIEAAEAEGIKVTI